MKYVVDEEEEGAGEEEEKEQQEEEEGKEEVEKMCLPSSLHFVYISENTFLLLLLCLHTFFLFCPSSSVSSSFSGLQGISEILR